MGQSSTLEKSLRQPARLLSVLGLLAALIGALLAVAAPAAFASGNDYPYASVNPAVTPADPWGFGIRQCTSFVAWRLHQHGVPVTDYGFVGPNGHSAVWGDASNWASAAAQDGYAEGTVAEVGAIAQWDANESSPFYSAGSSVADGSATAGADGHVAWVMAVYADGSALVEQYNGNGGDLAYSTMRVRAPRYLYIAVARPAPALPTLAARIAAGRSVAPSAAPVGVYVKLYDPAAGNSDAAHRAVRLYARSATSRYFVPIASAYTGATGVAGFAVRPILSTEYQACSGWVCTGAALIRVIGAVGARLAAVRSHVALLSGGVHPAAGQRVYLQAPDRGRWVTVGSMVSVRGGAFGFRVAEHPVPYRVYLPATAASGAAVSGVVRVP